METVLAADKKAIRDQEMSPTLELRPCHSEICTECSVWHQVHLMDVGGECHCRRPVTSPVLLPPSRAGPSFPSVCSR